MRHFLCGPFWLSAPRIWSLPMQACKMSSPVDGISAGMYDSPLLWQNIGNNFQPPSFKGFTDFSAKYKFPLRFDANQVKYIDLHKGTKIIWNIYQPEKAAKRTKLKLIYDISCTYTYVHLLINTIYMTQFEQVLVLMMWNVNILNSMVAS